VRGTERRRPAATRAVLWLVGGLLVTALAIVAMAPELLGDLSGLGGLGLVVIAAGIPGLAVVLVLAARRRSERDDTEDPPPHTPGHVTRGPR
jgi:hypothetical protein